MRIIWFVLFVAAAVFLFLPSIDQNTAREIIRELSTATNGWVNTERYVLGALIVTVMFLACWLISLAPSSSSRQEAELPEEPNDRQVRHELDHLTKRLARVEQSVSVEQLRMFAEKLAACQQRMTSLNALRTTFEEAKPKLAALKAQAEGLSDREIGVDAIVEKVGGIIGEIQGELDEIETDDDAIDEIESSIEALDERFAELEGSVKRIDESKAKLAGLADRVTRVNGTAQPAS